MSSSDSGGGLRGLMPFGDSDDDEALSADWGAPRSPPPPSVFEYAVRGAAGPALRVSTHAARGIGFQLWPAAHAAASYAEARHAEAPGVWRGVRVLELGAGCGLTGLVFAALGADVTLTDLEEVAEGLLAENVAANAEAVAAGGGRAVAAPLRWGDAAHAAVLLPPGGAPYDVLLAADVVYRRELFAPLLASLRALAAPRTQLLLAHLKRWGSVERAFWRDLARAWTSKQELLTAPPAPGQARPVRVFSCHLRDGGCANAAADEAACAPIQIA